MMAYRLIGFCFRKGLSDELVSPDLGLVVRVAHDAGHDERHDELIAWHRNVVGKWNFCFLW